MKKVLTTLLLSSAVTAAYAAQSVPAPTQNSNMTSASPVKGMSMGNADNEDFAKMMYADFGLGIGKAAQWNKGSVAVNAISMGFYINKTWAVEMGMDALPDGNTSTGEAQVMTYYLTSKGMLPISNSNFSLFGKAGLGVNAYEGEKPSGDMTMANQTSVGLYLAAGAQYDFTENFGVYTQISGVAVPHIGANGNTTDGSDGSTYMATIGLEARI